MENKPRITTPSVAFAAGKSWQVAFATFQTEFPKQAIKIKISCVVI